LPDCRRRLFGGVSGSGRRIGPIWSARGCRSSLEHARDFIDKRLAAAEPVNDGKQTPFRGRPVFVAQHATATCCRGCLAKWHGIPRGRPLDAHEKVHIVAVLERWLRVQEEPMGAA